MRLTIRRMMLAVAAFAVSMNIGLLYRLSGGYRRQARFYARAGERAAFRARNVESGAARLDGYTDGQKRKVVDQARRFVEYASRMKSKYDQAAYLPWLPVEPDPPPP